MSKHQRKLLKKLNDIYAKYNKRRFISPDPLEVLRRYKNTADREIAALIASSLAYGNVGQILKAVNFVLSKLGRNPKKFIMSASENKLKKSFEGFKYRFTKDSEIVNLLIAIKKAIKKYGCLNRCFLNYFDKKDPDISKAICGFVQNFDKCPSLIPCSNRQSAFKRMNLYLRWLVRTDDVDPGGWKGISKSKLVIPLDTHMYKTAKKLGFTKRKSADLKAALEITRNFAKICPEDPVKFDFALTRFGIRKKRIAFGL